MATFSGLDLREWRNSQGISAAALGREIGLEESAIYRIEKEEQTPDPDRMMQICRVLGDESKWDDWMRTVWSRSYGRMHPEPVTHDMPGSILSLYAVMDEIAEMQRMIFSDAADGKIDDAVLAQRTRDCIRRLTESAMRIKVLLEKK